MSDKLKVQQPTLKVTDESQVGSNDDEGAAQCFEEGHRQDSGDAVVSSAPSPGQNIQAATLPQAASDRSPGDESEPAAALYEQAARSHGGIFRHRLIVAGCISLSLIVLALSLVDLSSLIKFRATLDSHMTVQRCAPPPQLSPSLHYANSLNYVSYYEPVFSNGLTSVIESNWQGKRVGYVNESGLVVINPQFVEVSRFREGLAAVTMDPESPQRCGYINTQGKFVIPAKFRGAGPFEDGVAPVLLEDGCGALVNKRGDIVGARLGSYLPRTIGGIFIAGVNPHKFGLLDKQGNWILPPEYSQIAALPVPEHDYWDYYRVGMLTNEAQASAYYLKICKDSKWGVADRTGKVIIPPKFDQVIDFNKEHAIVTVDGKYGFADINGKIVIQPQFDDTTSYDDLIAVKTGGKWRFINPEGKPVGKEFVDGIICSPIKRSWLTDGLGAVIKNGHCGFVNGKGEFAKAPKFEFVYPFSNGYAAVFEDGLWHYIDVHGRALPGSFATISPFSNGKAHVTVAGPLYRFANATTIDRTKDLIKQNIEHWTRPDFVRELDNNDD